VSESFLVVGDARTGPQGQGLPVAFCFVSRSSHAEIYKKKIEKHFFGAEACNFKVNGT
jgi:hypothetical protein